MPPVLRPSLRHTARTALDDLTFALALRALPPRVALTQLRARATARRGGDTFSLTSTTRPRDLATILELARGRRHVVELGTGTAWTTIALAMVQADRQVWSYDPLVQAWRDAYLTQIPAAVRTRIHLVQAPGASGPRGDTPVEMLYVDSFHDRETTLAEVAAWAPAMAPGAIMVFDDYTHSVHTGVARAIDELGLAGHPQGGLFIHRPS